MAKPKPADPATEPQRRSSPEPGLVDLDQFGSLEDALTKVQPGDRYFHLGSLVVPHADGLPLTVPAMFWFSMLTRSQGLHRRDRA